MTPETRSLLLENLAAGFPPRRALSHACGKRMPVVAWRELQDMRKVGGDGWDAEVAEACERAEREEEERKARDGGEAERDGRDEGGQAPPVGGVQVQVEAGPWMDQGGPGSGLGGAHGHLFPGRGGRATGEEEAEGGGERGVGAGSGRETGGGDRGVGVAPSIAAIFASGADDEAPDSGSRISSGEDFSNDFARVMVEARATYGPGRIGLFKWIDARGQMMRPALHPIEPLWIGAFAEYYDSRKLIMLARKGLRAGGSSSACPALTRCALFAERTLDAGTIGVVPIMSSTRDEADGRFVTIRSYLRAVGYVPQKKGKRGADEDFGGGDEPDEDGITYQVPRGGVAGVFQSKRSASGGGIIAIQDRHGHRIQFRILPALVKHGVGYTGAAGFADESDLWPNDPEHHVNPAEKILDRISERFTTTYNEYALMDDRLDPGAEMLVFSASYNADSAHKRAVDAALRAESERIPDPLTHLVRLGAEGARRDEDARRTLAVRIRSDDPRLLAPGDPLSPDLPAWAFNPNDADIAKCHAFSKGDISRMLAKYGGRAEENVARSKMTLEDAKFMATQNRELQHPLPSRRVVSADGLFDYTGIPGAGDGGARRWRGL